jgi:GNAT superfamily N-acetyltransferase
VIRPAREHEIAALVAAYDWLFAPPGSQPRQWDPDAARQRLLALIASAEGEIFIAEADGVVAGICTVVLDLESVRFGRRAWVEDLAVHPGHRSAGFGKALLNAAKDWGREHGATHLELDSGQARTEAHRFYEREQPSWSSISYGWEL